MIHVTIEIHLTISTVKQRTNEKTVTNINGMNRNNSQKHDHRRDVITCTFAFFAQFSTTMSVFVPRSLAHWLRFSTQPFQTHTRARARFLIQRNRSFFLLNLKCNRSSISSKTGFNWQFFAVYGWKYEIEDFLLEKVPIVNFKRNVHRHF